MRNAYHAPPGGALTANAARLTAGLAGPRAVRRGRRGVRFYMPSPMYMHGLGFVSSTRVGPQIAGIRRRRLRWLGQDDGDGSVPDITDTSFASTLPSDLETPIVSPQPPQVGPTSVPLVSTSLYPTSASLTAPIASPASLTSAQIAALTAQSIAAGIAPALAASAAQQGRAYAVATPTNTFSAALSSIPAWAWLAGAGVAAFALIGGKKGRR